MSARLQHRRDKATETVPEAPKKAAKAVIHKPLKELGFGKGDKRELLSLPGKRLKHLQRSLQSFGSHFAIVILAVFVMVAGIKPVSNASATNTPTQGRTIAQIVSNEYFEEDVVVDEVITTVGENNDYIFKTGTTETIISRNNRTETINYEVKQGESAGTVARDFGIATETLQYANKLTGNALTVGQKLKIPPIDGIYVTVQRNDTLSGLSNKYKVNVAEISKYNPTIETDQPIFQGQEIFMPGVVAPKATTPTSTTPGSPRVTPSRQGNVPSTILATPGQFIWPTQVPTHFLSQGFKRGHTGLDLPRQNGFGIYASASGIAHVIPGRTGYGNHIDIDHGNGWMTRYGHLSEFKIQNGQYVKQGELIGIMGTTGRSTGIHLHFEIRLRGAAMNPLSYLPR